MNASQDIASRIVPRPAGDYALLADGRRFRTVTILDVYTRQCLDIAVGRGLTGQDVAATLERSRFGCGLPQRI